jgi:hypothetical protein
MIWSKFRRVPTSKELTCNLLQERLLDHGIGGALTNLKQHGVFPSEIGIDLLVIAAHVYAADTRISRAEQSQDSWTREIRLVVPVSDMARWGIASSTLKKALDFLTGTDGRSSSGLDLLVSHQSHKWLLPA